MKEKLKQAIIKVSGGNIKVYDLLIVGGGPAGLTAAIYAARAGLDVGLCEAFVCGGKMMNTSDIENWPGEKLISGSDLSLKMYEHAVSFGCEEIYENIQNVDRKTIELDGKEYAYFSLNTSSGLNFLSLAVIVASGSEERKLGIKGEDEYRGSGVSYCAVCDASFFKGDVICVIGGGNSAFEEAIYLSKYGKEVHLVMRRDVARADAMVVAKAEKTENLYIHHNYLPLEIIGDSEHKVKQIVFEDKNSKNLWTLDCKAVFPFVGLTPKTEFVKNLGICNEQGFIKTDAHMATAIKGLYAAGDCRDTVLRQIITAEADGAVAAQAVVEYFSVSFT